MVSAERKVRLMSNPKITPSSNQHGFKIKDFWKMKTCALCQDNSRYVSKVVEYYNYSIQFYIKFYPTFDFFHVYLMRRLQKSAKNKEFSRWLFVKCCQMLERFFTVLRQSRIIQFHTSVKSACQSGVCTMYISTTYYIRPVFNLCTCPVN